MRLPHPETRVLIVLRMYLGTANDANCVNRETRSFFKLQKTHTRSNFCPNPQIF